MAGAGRVMTGKVAVITGAAEGIGAGLVTGYRGRGWSVLASATILRPPNEPEVLAVEGDIADPAGADRVIDAALERFGRLDTLVNNAGMVISKPFTDYTTADYAHVVGVSLTGFFWITQRAIAAMTTWYGGHVVNVSAAGAGSAGSGTPAVLAALTEGGLAAATGRWRSSTPLSASGSTPSLRASSGLRPRSAPSLTASCSWSPRPTSPVRSCTSLVPRRT